MSTLSLCAIVKDESARIVEFIDRNLEWCDEIVLVDTGSADDTIEKISKKDVILLNKPLNNNFSDARNYGLRRAKSDWIITLDCDEHIDKQFRDLILKSIDAANAHAFLLPCVTVHGFRINTTYRISLFKNKPSIKYEGLVYEQVSKSVRDAQFPIALLDAPIYHFPHTEGKQKHKNDFYRSLLKLEAINDPSNPRTNYFLAMDALTNKADPESALKYHIQGVKGKVSECAWPVEYIQNALSAARMMRSSNPLYSLEILRNALEIKKTIENEPAPISVRALLLEVEALHFDCNRSLCQV